jgi:hypothetical protein
MSINRELRDQIRCLALDADHMTVLDSGGLVHNVLLEVADASTNLHCDDRDPVLVSLSPNQARELASSLWWLADRSERIAAGIR